MINTTYTIGFSSNFPAAASTIGGTILADVRLTAGTDNKVEWFKMTGGRISQSNTDATVNGGFNGTARIITSGVAGTPRTDSTGGAVTVATGVSSNIGHYNDLNEGTITIRHTPFAGTMTESITNLALTPESVARVGTTILTTSTPTASPNATTWWKRRRITLSHTQDVTETTISGTVSYSIRKQGSFSAIGEAVFPGDGFVSWAQANRGARPLELTDRDPLTGQPLLVMYAFRAGAGNWQVPVTFLPGTSQVRLQLPTNGLLAPVKWEYWSGNSPVSWAPIAGTPQAGGITPLGASGTLTIAIPAGRRGFIRASVPAP
ncbi:MAG: hypothetical protein CFE26_17600 [Verrucomicrobiales bacterium VVV1]|nr:MAG: hypothetical protein CFE26_17600 [Verrucomicrobiales bacterium VVV1]